MTQKLLLNVQRRSNLSQESGVLVTERMPTYAPVSRHGCRLTSRIVNLDSWAHLIGLFHASAALSRRGVTFRTSNQAKPRASGANPAGVGMRGNSVP